MDPFRAVAALHRPTPPGYISSAHCRRKDGTKVRVNVLGDQEEKDNKNTGKKEAGEEKMQATDFRECECCPSGGTTM